MLATIVSSGIDLGVSLPAGLQPRLAAGVFLLARAEEGSALDRMWQRYLRLALFPTQIDVRAADLRVALRPLSGDRTAFEWLLAREPGDRVDLLGPIGNGFSLANQSRTLLLAADAENASLLLPVAGAMLDRGGRVACLVRGSEDSALVLRRRLPLAVELHLEESAGYLATLGQLAGWADQVAMVLRAEEVGAAVHALRSGRYRLEPDFAQALLVTPLPCGCGACLSCLVPLANGGFTRACVHGPVFDIARLG